jgi:hypothetical protein
MRKHSDITEGIEEFELEREAEAAAAAAPYEGLGDTCCGCVICCCSSCDDHHRSARVREARTVRQEREHASDWRFERGERRFMAAVFGLCRICDARLSEVELDHDHVLCAACSVDEAQRQQQCFYGCGRLAEPITTRSGEVFPGVVCDECLGWMSTADPVLPDIDDEDDEELTNQEGN